MGSPGAVTPVRDSRTGRCARPGVTSPAVGGRPAGDDYRDLVAQQQHVGLELRRAVLAVSVLDDIDLTPRARGVVVEGPDGADGVRLSWRVVAAAHGPGPVGSPVGHRRLSVCLRLHRLVADLGPDAANVLRQSARALALPRDHAVHPGARWVRERPMGGALHLGAGVVGLLGDTDEVLPLPPSVASSAGLDLGAWWPHLVSHADGMGHLAVNRLRRDHHRRGTLRGAAATDTQAVLRPVGGVDVPTLLTTSSVRRYLATSDGSGMRAMAAPMRSRGWYDLARIDPAFVAAAWAATDEWERGLRRPVLVTADEIVLAPAGGNTVVPVLSDPASASQFARDVRYR